MPRCGSRAVDASMTSEPSFEPEQAIMALNRAGVAYVVVGGLAAGAHGVVRATRDLDIVPAGDPENMDRLAACLVSIGGEHPVEGSLTGALLAKPVSMKVHTNHGDVQVLNRMAGVPTFEHLHAHRVVVEIDDRVLAPVCSLTDLRTMKRAAGRRRDQVDLSELAELHGPG